MRRNALVGILLVVIFVSIIGMFGTAGASGGEGQYQKETIIKENSGKTLTDYQIMVELNQSNFPDKAKSDGSDLRFAEDGKELSYWIEDYDAGAKTARIWVKVPKIPANEETKIKMYYGNPSASAVSDGDATFVFFDDFEGSELDTNKWSETYNYPVWTVSNSILTLRTSASTPQWNEAGIKAPEDFSHDFRAIAKVKGNYDNADLRFYCVLGEPRYLLGLKIAYWGTVVYAYTTNSEDVSLFNYPSDSPWVRCMITKVGSRSQFYWDDFETPVYQEEDGLSDSYSLTRIGTTWRQQNVYCDYVFITKYADPEPIITIYDSGGGGGCGRITNWKTMCQGVYSPGQKVRAEMEFESLMDGGYNFRGVIVIRSPTGDEYTNSEVEWVPSAPNQQGKFAAGDALYVTIPEGASAGNYDMKLELWNDDAEELCDATEWKEDLFTVEGNTCPMLSDGKVEPLEGGESTNFVFSVTYKDEDGDEPVGKYVQIIGFQGTNKVYDETKEMIRGSGDIKMGVTYSYSATLPAVEYRFYFNFSDGECAAYLPEGGYPGFEGPNVTGVTAENHPPTATKIEPTSDSITIEPGETIEFKVKAEDVDEDVHNNLKVILWFVDGIWVETDAADGTSAEVSCSYTFENAGTFYVKATVFDEQMEEDSVTWAMIINVKRPSVTGVTSTNTIGMEFVLIPAGEFEMGSPSDEVGRDTDEGPVHHVTIKNASYMGRYEVTQKQWRAIMGDNPSYFTGDDLPVEKVSWNDVQEFIKKLNEKEGTDKYRLPSEAEWEHACRACTSSRYSFGDSESELGDYAWYVDNSDRKTHPVGQKKPNTGGLYDMHGNVWEWVQDKSHNSYDCAPADGGAWESGDGARRVVRGGSWVSDARRCRSANRGRNVPSARNNALGFRLLKEMETFTNTIGMEFVLIPAGDFEMGSPSDEEGRWDNEGPVHHVTIKNAFYMGRYEVTQKQWRAIMGDNPSYFKGDNLPVEYVSWNDVQEFIKKLNEKEGTDKYRLPSEAEWEYACRAGTTTRYSFGDSESELGDYAWYVDNSDSKTHPVGQKKPNSWGLYDLHGNVWEWVQDEWHISYDGAPADGSVWEGDGADRVFRGGSWYPYAGRCRSAVRVHSAPRFRGDILLGFRILQETRETFTNTIGMEFVRIPAGEFEMGSPPGWTVEGPVHHVTIKNASYMGRYEVTQKQWRAIMGDNPSYFKGDDLPVEQVSWDDVQEFIKKLNEKEGTDKYRLPSEAEWEYACRAGTTTRYSFGDSESELGDYAWYEDNSDNKTHPVGQKKPNTWELYDMHGNVWEWVQDDWHYGYDGAPADGGAWERGHGLHRVFRGGCWGNRAWDCKSAFRAPLDPRDRGDFLGFRLLKSL